MLAQTAKRLEENNIRVTFSDDVRIILQKRDMIKLTARPLRRTIQEK